MGLTLGERRAEGLSQLILELLYLGHFLDRQTNKKEEKAGREMLTLLLLIFKMLGLDFNNRDSKVPSQSVFYKPVCFHLNCFAFYFCKYIILLRLSVFFLFWNNGCRQI